MSSRKSNNVRNILLGKWVGKIARSRILRINMVVLCVLQEDDSRVAGEIAIRH